MATACQCMGRQRHTHTHMQTHQVRTYWAYAMDLKYMVVFNLYDEFLFLHKMRMRKQQHRLSSALPRVSLLEEG